MQFLQRALLALPVLAALLLAGCGADDDSKPAARMDTKEGPMMNLAPARVDTAAFVQLATSARCAERHNRLYVIDQTYVFWNTAGDCADASYAFKLYKFNTDNLVCAHGDSIAGPRTLCNDDTRRAFFDALVKNADAGNLGLDDTHTVEKVDLGESPQSWTDIDARAFSAYQANANLAIQDADAWIALWHRHAPGEPVPKIDFARQTVLAVFSAGAPNGCYKSAITAATLEARRLVVVRTDTVPGQVKPDAPLDQIHACTTAITYSSHIVALDKVDVPVEFVVKQREL